MSPEDSIKNSQETSLQAADTADQVTAITLQDPCSVTAEPC